MIFEKGDQLIRKVRIINPAGVSALKKALYSAKFCSQVISAWVYGVITLSGNIPKAC